MTDPRTEAALVALYTFEHDFPNVISFEEAARIMRNADAPHKGDCALAEQIYAATCMRCQRDGVEARARAALAAADAASIAGAGETLDGLICTGPDEHGTVRLFHADWQRAAALIAAQARRIAELERERDSPENARMVLHREAQRFLGDQREGVSMRARAALGKEAKDAR